ncbi:uncharacterized protein LOC143190870 [Rhynchophorus ferrugineus]|uniref:uncharacterized protein LOC143190870 n=1 Tax=Rhynchophorus ferrugineus TaxID=354439 RepID=UPI003FCD1A61
MRAKDSLASTVHSKVPSLKGRPTLSVLVNADDLTEPLVVVPPDGGWGWIIVSVSVLAFFTIDGISYCFGIFLQEISTDLKCEVTQVALASSVLGGFYYISGPFTCSAINRYGFRIIGVIGGLLCSTAFMIVSLVNSINPFIVIIGVCGGTGFNFLYTASVIAVSFYFEKWRVLAMAISCCGSSLGLICYPPLMTVLLKKLTWRRKFQIVSVCFGVCGLLCLTYKPLKSTKVEKTVQFGEISSRFPSISTMDHETEIPTGLTWFFQRFKNALFPTISETSVFTNNLSTNTNPRYQSKTSYEMFRNQRRDTETTSAFFSLENENEPLDSDSVVISGTNKCLLSCNCCREISGPKFSKCCSRSTNVSTTRINRPMYRDDIFYTGSVYHLSQYSRRGSQVSGATQRIALPSLAYTLSVSRAPTQRDLLQENRCVCCPEAFLRTLATLLDFRMLKSPTLVLLLISGFLSLIGTYTCFIYVQQRALEIGIDDNIAIMLLSIIGIANTIGRITCGIISCFPSLDINLITWVTLLICGGTTIASIYLTTNIGQIIFCSLFGVNIATFAVLRTIVFVECFGLENLTNCFGLNMIFQAMAAFCSVPIINVLYASFKSFNLCFIFTGVVIIISAILLIPLRCILKWEKKKTSS